MSIHEIDYVYDCDLNMNWVLRVLIELLGWLNVIWSDFWDSDVMRVLGCVFILYYGSVCVYAGVYMSF